MGSLVRSGTIAIAFVLQAGLASAQRPPDIRLDREMNRTVVENTIEAVDRYYLSAEVAERVGQALQARLAGGEYDAITSAFDLVDALDAHLQEASGDAHLRLAYSSEAGAPVREVGEDIRPETVEERAEALVEARRGNFGFQRVEILPGGVGLLVLSRFVRPAFAGERAGHVMSFLAPTEALIIDLREAQGGSPDMVVFLASYFFGGDEPQHLGDWSTRVEGGDQQCWTYPYLPGERYLDRDVYILTARRTFSAPEGLASFLQHHGKAIVVGEATAGGTHPGVMIRVHEHFAVFVPVSVPVYPVGEPISPLGRPIHPGRKPDLAGTGVQPDVVVPAERALQTAQLLALQKQLDRHPEQRERLERLIENLKDD